MTTLITGGAGYIGSHIVHELVDSGETVIAVDDLSTGFRSALPSVAPLFVGDCGDQKLIAALIDKHRISAIIHLAGSIVVPDSVRDPLSYYRNNTVNTRNLIEVAAKCGVRHFIFSSTAAVYGNSNSVPISEDAPTRPISPYGHSKLMSEIMLHDLAVEHGLHYVILRIFNVAGADPKLRTGLVSGHSSSLVKKAVEAALGTRPNIDVHGTKYLTPDGTGVRDYIHVSDLARAHSAALEYLRSGGTDATFNCGCGHGYSVLEVVKAVARVCGYSFPVRYVEPRPGDTARLVADVRRIRSALAWMPRFDDFDTIATHALAWEQHRLERRKGAEDAFLKIVAETGIPPAELQKLISTFRLRSRPTRQAGQRSFKAPSSPSVVQSAAISDSQPIRDAKKLTIGMATYDDYDGVYFTLQAIRLYHPEILSDVEFVVVDNNPIGPCGQALKDLGNWIPNYRYIPKGDISGTAVRDWVFREARGEFVLCIDCHILIVNGALKRLINYFKAHPDTKNLLQGPMIYDDLKGYATHFKPGWQAGMYGTWDADPAGADAEQPPFEIPMQGLGLFACRRSAWPGFNPAFRGFGGEEGYIHEKFRQRGGKVLCLPFLRWIHRFNRPLGTSYANLWEDRVRNYLIGFRELGWDTVQVVEHFRAFLGEQVWSTVVERLGPSVLSPEDEQPVELAAIGDDAVKKAGNGSWTEAASDRPVRP
jgi:UDP-glucose 4-epimerase